MKLLQMKAPGEEVPREETPREETPREEVITAAEVARLQFNAMGTRSGAVHYRGRWDSTGKKMAGPRARRS